MSAASRWVRKNWMALVAVGFVCTFGIVFAVKLYQATQWELLKTWNASYEIGEGAWGADIVAEWEADIFERPASEVEADSLVDFFIHVRSDMYHEEWVRLPSAHPYDTFVERVA